MDAAIDLAASWNAEYREKGIPSSWKEEPSTVVRWGLDNLPYLRPPLTNDDLVLDIGCGTGRNSLAVASITGASVHGVDYSSEAIVSATNRISAQEDDRVHFSVRDMREPIPHDTASVALAMDIFVYFHLLASSDRRSYRRELARVLGSDGILLLSLATSNDGYYKQCQPVDNNDDVAVVLDPEAGVGNVMHSLESLRDEMGDCFSLVMAWVKVGRGPMHGAEYERHTLATLWSTRQN